MRMVMPIGVDDFAKVRQGYYFVDKTGIQIYIIAQLDDRLRNG